LGLVVPPRDFEIGELTVGVDSEAKAIVLAFCRNLENRSIDVELLAPGKRALLKPSLETRLEEGAVPDGHRIGGDIRNQGAERAVHVRLFSGEASASGEIYLSSVVGDWYVGDVQLDLLDLLKEPVSEEGRFYPSSYGGLFQGL
jgi:hypothetical protein